MLFEFGATEKASLFGPIKGVISPNARQSLVSMSAPGAPGLDFETWETTNLYLP